MRRIVDDVGVRQEYDGRMSRLDALVERPQFSRPGFGLGLAPQDLERGGPSCTLSRAVGRVVIDENDAKPAGIVLSEQRGDDRSDGLRLVTGRNEDVYVGKLGRSLIGRQLRPRQPELAVSQE